MSPSRATFNGSGKEFGSGNAVGDLVGNVLGKASGRWLMGGANGVERIVEIALDADEQAMFDNSVAAVKALNEVVDNL